MLAIYEESIRQKIEDKLRDASPDIKKFLWDEIEKAHAIGHMEGYDEGLKEGCLQVHKVNNTP